MRISFRMAGWPLRLLLPAFLCIPMTGAGQGPQAPDAAAAVPAVVNLLPQPAQVTRCEGRLAVPKEATYSLSLQGEDAGRFARALDRLDRDTGTVFRSGEPALLQVSIAAPGPAYPQLDTDESYHLDIDANRIRLEAANVYGAMHGLTTLAQLLSQGRELECVSIADIPRYRWRGLLIDVVRHWMPLDVIKRQVDAMAHYKMNVLHWHLTDDQGFRVESLRHPALHRKGSDGNFYTQAQVRELVEYAADRGVRVVPEFDLPGHSRSWQIAYPQLASVPGKQYWLYHQESLFSDPLDPTLPENLALIEAIVREMSALFPDRYFHVGGDEVDTGAWEDNPRIRQFIRDHGLEDEQGLQAWFIEQYAGWLQELGKTPMGWDEVAGDRFPADGVIHKWRKAEYTAADRRHPIVLSAGFYLDHMQSAWRHYRNDPAGLPGADGADVLGGEAAAWAESMDQHTLDARIWPRTLAVAELLWSPQAYTAGQGETALYHRLDRHSAWLETMGMQHLRHMPQWFEQLLGPENAAQVITLAAVSRPQPFAFMVTDWQRFFRWPWDKTIDDRPHPLLAFVDHLPPESVQVRRFNEAVERYLESRDARDCDYLLAQLRTWRDNHAKLLAAIAEAPELQQAGVADLSAALKELAEAGLAALDALESGRPLAGAQALDVVQAHAFTDPELSFAWLRADMLQWRNLFRPRILLQVKLPVQRGIARLVEAGSA